MYKQQVGKAELGQCFSSLSSIPLYRLIHWNEVFYWGKYLVVKETDIFIFSQYISIFWWIAYEIA